MQPFSLYSFYFWPGESPSSSRLGSFEDHLDEVFEMFKKDFFFQVIKDFDVSVACKSIETLFWLWDLIWSQSTRGLFGQEVLALECFFPSRHSDLSVFFPFIIFSFGANGRDRQGIMYNTRWTISFVQYLFMVLCFVVEFLVFLQ